MEIISLTPTQRITIVRLILSHENIHTGARIVDIRDHMIPIIRTMLPNPNITDATIIAFLISDFFEPMFNLYLIKYADAELSRYKTTYLSQRQLLDDSPYLLSITQNPCI